MMEYSSPHHAFSQLSGREDIMIKNRRLTKHVLAMLLVFAVTFVFAFAFAGADSYAASKSKKYYLPTEIHVDYFDPDEISSWLTDITYDKYGNMTSALISDMIPVTFKIKYRNKKGAIASVTFGDGETTAKKPYDKKGRLTNVKFGSDTYKYTKNKKGKVKKVTRNGKLYYSVKSIKYRKNGFVSKVTYSNGNVNRYNTDGLMTSAVVKNGPKYTYEYTRENGKVVKVLVKRNGVKYKQVTLKYGSATTKDLWKFSSVINYADGPSNAAELCTNNSLSGFNCIFD